MSRSDQTNKLEPWALAEKLCVDEYHSVMELNDGGDPEFLFWKGAIEEKRLEAERLRKIAQASGIRTL